MKGQASLSCVLLIAWLAAPPRAQSVSVSAAGDVLAVRAVGFSFIKGETLVRLKDGRSVRVDLELGVLPAPRAPASAGSRQTFVLSYDLWEERFAVTHAAAEIHSVSHLTAARAEAWCLERLTVPVASLGRLGRDLSFWIRLEYRVLDADGVPPLDNGTSFTIQSLIEALSRRRRSEELSHVIEAGPFRLQQ